MRTPDTIGYKIRGRTTGHYSDIVTTSFYASHIVTGAGFGGMVCFNDKKFYEKAKVLRAWEDLQRYIMKMKILKIDLKRKIKKLIMIKNTFF